MSHAPADAETTIAAIGMTAASFEELRTRSRARTAEPGHATQDETDVAQLIDDRDGLIFELFHEAIRVNELVNRLRIEGNEPDLPYTELPADVSVSEHAAQLGLAKLEKPMTIAEAAAAADEDGFLTAIVEISIYDMMEGRVNEEAGEDYPIVREMVEEEPEPVQMGYEVIGTSPTNMLTLVARFDLREALGFRHDSEELDEMFGTAA